VSGRIEARHLAAPFVALGILVTSTTGSAQVDDSPFTRDPGWGTAAGTVALLWGEWVLDQTLPGDPGWRRRNAFDEGLRIGRPQPWAGAASDHLRTALMAWPWLDAIGVSIARRDAELGLRLGLMNAQAFGLTTLVSRLTKLGGARERPWGRECEGEQRCDSDNRYRSFISGHTARAFTGAGLVCARARNVPTRHREVDAMTCGAALTAASAVATFRVLGDHHWTSDVLGGAAIGLLAGWALPKLLFFRDGPGTGLYVDGLGLGYQRSLL